MNNREITLAYIAGALDGDGSFSLIKGSSPTSKSPLYYPMIQLANASKDMIDFVCAEFGGATNIRKAYIAKDGHARKTSHQWKLEKSTKCLPVLKDIIPYLVTKKERAEFLHDYIISNPFIRGAGKLSDCLLFRREQAYLKMKSFNEVPCTKGFLLSIGKRKDSDSDIFWSYIAGLMDTDGSFSLKRENRKSGGSISPVYTPAILLTMTDCRSIYHLMNNFIGGNLMVVRAKTATNGFCYRFSITSRKNAIVFLRKCIPFLRLKKQTARTLLKFCETTKLMNGPTRVSEEELFLREKYYSEIVQLNKYGVSKSSLIDLEFLPGNAGDNKAQAAQSVQRERSKREDIVR